MKPRALEATYFTAVQSIIWRRAAEARTLTPATSASGRLLVYFPDANHLSDGLAEDESRGYFDMNNAPPWGTWVGMFEDHDREPSVSSYAAAWVPEAFVDLASAGIDVCPEACIQWLSESDTTLASLL